MGLWGQLCTIGLALFHGPTSLWDTGRQEVLPLPHSSSSGAIPDHHLSAVEDINGPPPGIYSPDIWEPTIANPLDHKPSPNTYNDPFTTANKCNKPSSRKQWCFGTTIETDYEDRNLVPITGVVRKYTLNITSTDRYCADGYCKNATLINGQYPGPLLRGNWGDTFEITVNNQLTNCNGTSFHWHGIRQWRTVWEDGVSGVTQCPIAPGKSQTYRWRAMQYGTSWYHSHFSLQYANGIAGPLVIDGPTSANYDVDMGPLMLTDWYHHDAFGQYHNEIAARPPTKFLDGADSVLINGRGNFTSYFKVSPGTGDAPPEKYMDFGCVKYNDTHLVDEDCVGEKYASRFVTEVEPSREGLRRYKYRLINMSTVTHFAFWIDDHEFEVVATDFVPIIPVKRKFVNVAIGQRYDIIITAKPAAVVEKHPNYWIKMRLCNNYCLGDPCPKGESCTYVECRQGILSYDKVPRKGPIRSPDYHAQPPPDVPEWTDVHQLCTDPELDTLNPVVRRDLRNAPGLFPSMQFDDPFEVDRRAGTQNITEVFGEDPPSDDDPSQRPPADDPSQRPPPINDPVQRPPVQRPPNAPLHPVPPPIDPLDATKPHIWDFGSSRKSPDHPNGTYVSFMIDWANPGLMLADDGVPAMDWNPRYFPVILDTPEAWTVFAIASNWTSSENHGRFDYQTVPGGAHPIHLHGHDFVVLHQSNPGDTFYYDKKYEMDLVNPVRRDVVMLPANGFVVIAFKADNPGTWLMHCHIAWHASSGLALQWVERPSEIPGLVDDEQRSRMDEQCADWKAHEESMCVYHDELAIQDDSGI